MDTEKVWAMFWMISVISVSIMFVFINKDVQKKELQHIQAGLQMKKQVYCSQHSTTVEWVK